MITGILHVLFKVADAEYAIAASDVLHLESYAGATRVPSTAVHVVGLVQIRGRVVPVVDLRSRFGLPPADRTIDSRVVVETPAGTSRASNCARSKPVGTAARDPATLFWASDNAKFIRPNSAAELIHSSLRLEYPVGSTLR